MSLLKIMFEEEARVQLLMHFGFSAKPTENGDASPLEDDTLVNEELLKLSLNDNNSLPSEDALLPTPPVIYMVEERTLESPDDVEDFFDKLAPPTPTKGNGPPLETPSSEEKEEAHVAEQEAGVVEVPVTTTKAGKEAADSESEAAI
jgi:protein transport protein SEC31